MSGVFAYLAVLFVWEWGDYASLVANTVAIVPAGIILIVAIIVFITAIVGCCGVYHKNKCTLGAVSSVYRGVAGMSANVLTYFTVIEFHCAYFADLPCTSGS